MAPRSRRSRGNEETRRPFRSLPDWAGPTTRLVHGGSRPDLNAGSIAPPIYQTSTFRYPPEFSEAAPHEATYLYSRNGNPTVEAAEELVRDAEGAEAGRLFASGMGAIAATLLSLLGRGDELLLPTGLYGGTTGLVRSHLGRFGIEAKEPSEGPAATPEARIGPRTKIVYVETPTNPTLRVHDLSAWARAAHGAGALLVVDNTIASPVNQTPIRWGADLVVHSATKYLGGHADLTAGAVVGRRELIERIDPSQTFGAPLDPFAAFLLHRSLKTLALRVGRINGSAAAIATALADEPAVARVHYPGTAGREDEAICRRQMSGRGGLLSFSLRGGAAASDRFCAGLRIVQVASSFGGVESLVSLPRVTSHRHLSAEERTARGIDPGFVRLSVGIEETEDLLRDIRTALAAV